MSINRCGQGLDTQKCTIIHCGSTPNPPSYIASALNSAKQDTKEGSNLFQTWTMNKIKFLKKTLFILPKSLFSLKITKVICCCLRSNTVSTAGQTGVSQLLEVGKGLFS